MKILILTRYNYDGPSSRYRYFQYLKFFEEKNWNYEIKPLLPNNYIKYLFGNGKIPFSEIILSYFKRALTLLFKRKYDLIWLEQEAFPWIPFFIEKIFLKGKTKIVSDYDDAFFHRYDLHKTKLIRFLLGKKIDSVMHNVDIVFSGNDYISERAKLSNAKKIIFLPTVVDTNKYKKIDIDKNNIFTIGWLGTPTTSVYLYELENVFEKLYKLGNIKFSFVGARKLEFKNFEYHLIEWDEEKEVEEISKFDVGIMPLKDGPFERGKCGFKLIQYLACEIPVVGSPVGINDKIIQHGINGFKATNENEWYEYLLKLKDDRDLREKMGKNGRALVEEKYSLKNNAKKIIDNFEKLVNN
ncbi:MAG: glycosyltransferase [Melioribacteraceae bacterium]|nr:glycosyltransferase [Melioribacteraceae bacterium]